MKNVWNDSMKCNSFESIHEIHNRNGNYIRLNRHNFHKKNQISKRVWDELICCFVKTKLKLIAAV